MGSVTIVAINEVSVPCRKLINTGEDLADVNTSAGL